MLELKSNDTEKKFKELLYYLTTNIEKKRIDFNRAKNGQLTDGHNETLEYSHGYLQCLIEVKYFVENFQENLG